MKLHAVAKTSDITELEPFIVTVENTTIGIYRFNGKYYAYENECAHEGGPVMEGTIVGDPECKLSPEGKKLGESYSETKMDIVCPWHGTPYDIKTGICRSDSRKRLVSHEIVVQGDEVKVRI
jgi:nitrite reductase (NADH) small subunit